MGVVHPFGHGEATAPVEINAATNAVAAAPGYASLGCGTFGRSLSAPPADPVSADFTSLAPPLMEAWIHMLPQAEACHQAGVNAATNTVAAAPGGSDSD